MTHNQQGAITTGGSTANKIKILICTHSAALHSGL